MAFILLLGLVSLPHSDKRWEREKYQIVKKSNSIIIYHSVYTKTGIQRPQQSTPKLPGQLRTFNALVPPGDRDSS